MSKVNKETKTNKKENNNGGGKGMNVLGLSIELSKLDPMLDSKQHVEDGKLYRDVMVVVRSGDESVIRINETEEGEFELLGKFNKLGKELGENLVAIIENYCATPVAIRLAK